MRHIADVDVVRHPLQELVVDTFVPNDVRMAAGGSTDARVPFDDDEDATDSGEDDAMNSIVICTGANACGKVKHHLTKLQKWH